MATAVEPGTIRSVVTVVQNQSEWSTGNKRRRSYSRSLSPHREIPRKQSPNNEKWVEKEAPPESKKRKDDPENILTRTGGAYIPPARLRMMQAQITDKTSVAYQRMAWEALKKSINGLINKVNVTNIADIVRELFQENIVRGRGLLARSIISAQSASPTFTHVYAALVSIINTKFPQTGELIIKRLVIQFRKAYKRNDKKICLASVRFIAHLVNQQVLHELLALELLMVLLDNPTSDSVEVAVGFLKECGAKLSVLSPRGILGVFESLKGILHDGSVDVRVQYMIEVMFAIRKDKFSDYPAVVEGLDLIQEDDQITHLVSLDDELDGENTINVFKSDSDYLENEEKYRAIKEEILGEGSSDDEEDNDDSGDNQEENEEGEEDGEMKIIDETQTDLMGLRRTVYLTIMSSLDFEECAHKILKMTLKPNQELEVANMIIECCSQERSYQRFYGLLGERFCHLNESWVEKFDTTFQEQYSTVHRLEANKLRNVAKFFAQLFYTDALPWTSLSCIHLNEEETNSSSRIFVKILFQELAEYMGLQKLNERLKDQTLASYFEGLLPRDNPKNTRFAINFFTSIGLGGLTDDLREHLKNAPKMIMSQDIDSSDDDSSSSSNSSEDDSSEDSSSDSSESSESSESDAVKRKRVNEKRRKTESKKRKDEKRIDERRKKKESVDDHKRKKDEKNRRSIERSDEKKERNGEKEREKRSNGDRESRKRDRRSSRSDDEHDRRRSSERKNESRKRSEKKKDVDRDERTDKKSNDESRKRHEKRDARSDSEEERKDKKRADKRRDDSRERERTSDIRRDSRRRDERTSDNKKSRR